MAASANKNPTKLSIICYHALLMMYPPAHRREYGPLMVQLFQDLCRDGYTQRGMVGLLGLWIRTLPDMLISAADAHLEVAKEGLMTAKQAAVPIPWSGVMLVVLPGILFGITRAYYPLYWLAVGGFALVVILAVVVLAAQKQVPVWGLPVLGLLLYGILLRIGVFVMTELAAARVAYSTRHLLLASPLWLAIIVLAWKYKSTIRMPAWVWILLALVTVGASALLNFSVLTTIGLMLLPVALGLPLARQHGTLALLLVVGAYSLWLFDSDFYAGPLLKDMAFYPLYVFLLVVFFISTAPLLLLRARSERGRAIGLLTPIMIVLLARVVVPWLTHPNFHPPRVWLGDTGLSIFALLIFVLAFMLYNQRDSTNTTEAGQSAYTGQSQFSFN